KNPGTCEPAHDVAASAGTTGWPALSALGRTGLQRQRVQLAAHFALERLINDLGLLDARFSAERLGNDSSGVMAAVASQVADGHLRIRYPRSNQPLDIARAHGHGSLPRGCLGLCMAAH